MLLAAAGVAGGCGQHIFAQMEWLWQVDVGYGGSRRAWQQQEAQWQVLSSLEELCCGSRCACPAAGRRTSCHPFHQLGGMTTPSTTLNHACGLILKTSGQANTCNIREKHPTRANAAAVQQWEYRHLPGTSKKKGKHVQKEGEHMSRVALTGCAPAAAGLTHCGRAAAAELMPRPLHRAAHSRG